MLKYETAVNRQIGDYVVVAVNPDRPDIAEELDDIGKPYAVRKDGATKAVSYHWDVTDAVQAIMRYRAADKRRAG